VTNVADALVRRLAAETEEDERLGSMCHLVFGESLRGPLADRLEAHLDAADAAAAADLARAYWDLVDRSEGHQGVAGVRREARAYRDGLSES
jgi:hypothetical protein